MGFVVSQWTHSALATKWTERKESLRLAWSLVEESSTATRVARARRRGERRRKKGRWKKRKGKKEKRRDRPSGSRMFDPVTFEKRQHSGAFDFVRGASNPWTLLLHSSFFFFHSYFFLFCFLCYFVRSSERFQSPPRTTNGALFSYK